MEKMRPDSILQTLRRAGYEAWFVGGCVRDSLLGRPIHDWDVTTSALPEQVMACFDRCVPTGLRHGTVTVLTEQGPVEVTTYRTDGDYPDGRHPAQVTFVRSLQEDLARRDFTVNAMAVDEAGNLVDLYGGREDLANKLLRCVGDPEKRFREDALRMLRAIRFSAQLDFAIEPKTQTAMENLGHLCAGLSAERVRDELEKTLLSAHPERVQQIAALGLPEEYGLDKEVDCRWLANVPAERIVRWAGLCRLYPKLDLMMLRLDKLSAQDAMTAGRLAVPKDELGWKYLIADYGVRRAEIVGALAGERETVERLLASGDCLTLKQLAVKGRDLPHLEGKAVGEHLQKLLYHVLEHPEDNQKEILQKISKKF